MEAFNDNPLLFLVQAVGILDRKRLLSIDDGNDKSIAFWGIVGGRGVLAVTGVNPVIRAYRDTARGVR